MTPIFVDTSYYLALVSPRDAYHSQAGQLAVAIERPLLVTEFVLLEVGNALSRGGLRQLFVEMLAQIRSDPHTVVVPASPDLFDKGCQLYARRRDKTWSLTDCTSFVAMEEYQVTDALTTDRHFEQAGFNVLLK